MSFLDDIFSVIDSAIDDFIDSAQETIDNAQETMDKMFHSDYDNYSDYDDYSDYSDAAYKARRRREELRNEIEQQEDDIKSFISSDVRRYTYDTPYEYKEYDNLSDEGLKKMNRAVVKKIKNNNKKAIEREAGKLKREVTQIESVLQIINEIEGFMDKK